MVDFSPLLNIGVAGTVMVFMLYLFRENRLFMKDLSDSWQEHVRTMREENRSVMQGHRNEMIHMAEILDGVKGAFIEHDTRLSVFMQKQNLGNKDST